MTSNCFENTKLDAAKLYLILAIFIFANHVKLWRDIFSGKFGVIFWRDLSNLIFGGEGARDVREARLVVVINKHRR